MRLGELWWGGIPVDYSDEQKRLIHDVQPVYPDTARQAGIEGNVTLRLLIGKDGHVQEVRPLSGQRSAGERSDRRRERVALQADAARRAGSTGGYYRQYRISFAINSAARNEHRCNSGHRIQRNSWR